MAQHNNIQHTAQECIRMIKKVEFDRLGISEYNLKYINHLLPVLDYYFKIYIDAIERLVEKTDGYTGWVVDFGGGHGFLSVFLKQLGFKVIYCDINPLSVNTVRALKEKLSCGPDVEITGSTDELLDYCRRHQLPPDYLISTDLIEHVYDLNQFFSQLRQLNPGMEMVFTTASNPYNFRKAKYLRKLMLYTENEFFLPSRKEYIEKNYPELMQVQKDELSVKTRGLIFQDINSYVETYIATKDFPRRNIDPYNTCDPQTGNWMERILPIPEYRRICNSHQYSLTIHNGFYNAHRKHWLFSLVAFALNLLIRYGGLLGRCFAPFITLKVIPSSSK